LVEQPQSSFPPFHPSVSRKDGSSCSDLGRCNMLLDSPKVFGVEIDWRVLVYICTMHEEKTNPKNKY